MNIIKWKDAINSCKYDESVGIRIAKLAGNDQCSTFITEIDPQKRVKPHFHKSGDEHYHIISGRGEMRLKNILTGEEKIYSVSEYETFVVPENYLHELVNNGEGSLMLMFSCPISHLNDDRYFL